MTETDTDVDAERLESHLSEELDETVVQTEVLHAGVNLSVAISTEDAERAYVLRRPNKLRHTDLFNDLRREYRLMQRLEATPIRAPAPVSFCADESILDGPFFVMTHLDGAGIPVGANLPDRFRDPNSRGRVAERLVDALAEIHSVDVEPFEGVCERQTPREQVERAVERLDQARSVTGRELPALRDVGEWLGRNVPADSKTALVHGDFKPGNVFFAGMDRPELAGVVDWEAALLGDPLTELGYVLLYWRDDGDPTLPLDELEARYSNEDAMRDLREINETGLCPFAANPGSPSRRELVARYEEKAGISFENERFYRAHAAFMLATVWEDLHRHQIEAGAESNYEPQVDYMSMVASSIVDGEFGL